MRLVGDEGPPLEEGVLGTVERESMGKGWRPLGGEGMPLVQGKDSLVNRGASFMAGVV